MEKDFFIKKLEEQKRLIYTTDFLVWLSTTKQYIEDYFGFTSSQFIDFSGFISDYKIKLIGAGQNKLTVTQEFQKRAIEFVNSYLKYVKEYHQRQKQDEWLSIVEALHDDKEKIVEQNTITNPSPKIIKKDNPEMKEKKGTYLGLPLEASIPIALAILGGVFWFGHYVGQSRFDKEKSDFYEENKELRKTLDKLKIESSAKDSLILTKTDSIKILKDDLSASYLHLNELLTKRQ